MALVELVNGETRKTDKKRVMDVLQEMKLLDGSVLVVRGDDLLTPDIALAEDDVIRIIPVVSGG